MSSEYSIIQFCFSIHKFISWPKNLFLIQVRITFKANNLDILQSGIKSNTLIRYGFRFLSFLIGILCTQLTTIQYRDCEMTVTIKHYTKYTKTSYCSCDMECRMCCGWFLTIFRVQKVKHWHSLKLRTTDNGQPTMDHELNIVLVRSFVCLFKHIVVIPFIHPFERGFLVLVSSDALRVFYVLTPFGSVNGLFVSFGLSFGAVRSFVLFFLCYIFSIPLSSNMLQIV